MELLEVPSSYGKIYTFSRKSLKGCVYIGKGEAGLSWEQGRYGADEFADKVGNIILPKEARLAMVEGGNGRHIYRRNRLNSLPSFSDILTSPKRTRYIYIQAEPDGLDIAPCATWSKNDRSYAFNAITFRSERLPEAKAFAMSSVRNSMLADIDDLFESIESLVVK